MSTEDAPPGRWFSWAEFTRSTKASELGLDNSPDPEARGRIRVLCREVLDPLRDALGVPVRITSGYRSRAINDAVGGAARSLHQTGEAADIKVDGLAAEELARRIAQLGLPVDQVVWYDPDRGGHVHVQHRANGHQRHQFLWAPNGGGYVPWRP